MRYNLYWDHRYIRTRLSELQQLVGALDWGEAQAVEKLKEAWKGIVNLLEHHSEVEDKEIHKLLIAKNSTVQLKIEEGHKNIQNEINGINKLLEQFATGDKNEIGEQLYQAMTEFVAINSQHMCQEEKIIMPALHKLYSDKELRAVNLSIFKNTTAQAMIPLLKKIFPSLPQVGKQTYLDDIRDSGNYQRLLTVWQGISDILTEKDKQFFTDRYDIQIKSAHQKNTLFNSSKTNDNQDQETNNNEVSAGYAQNN